MHMFKTSEIYFAFLWVWGEKEDSTDPSIVPSGAGESDDKTKNNNNKQKITRPPPY